MSQGQRTPRSTNVAPSASTNRRTLFVGSALAVASLAVVITITVISVYLGELQRRSGEPSDVGGHSFCCQNEVAKIARYVNTSLDPCQDFFSYVCSNAITYKHSEDTNVVAMLQRALITGMMPKGVPMRQAGHFLKAYYKTCVQTISNRHSFATAFVTALQRNEADLLREVDSRKAMMFIMVSGLKYGLGSCITFSYQLGAKLRLDIDAICHQADSILDYLNATVEALRKNADAVPTTEETLHTASLLCNQFQKFTPPVAMYEPKQARNNFSRDVWNVVDLEAGLNAHGFKLHDVKVIEVRKLRNIRVLYDFFTQDGLAGLKAAYLLWHTGVSCQKQFNTEGSGYSPGSFRACERSLFKMKELWDLFKAEVLTSPDKDIVAEEIFAAVKNAMYEQLRTSPIIEADDFDTLGSFFKNFTLQTPMSAAYASIPVPKATPDFAENLLRGRAYSLTITSARVLSTQATSTVWHHGTLAINYRYILLSPLWYNFIFTGSTSFQLLNMAGLGQRLAEILWVLTFYAIPWEPRTSLNTKNFRQCFSGIYYKKFPHYKDTRSVFLSALGLSTVVKALNLSEWHTVRPAWSLWRLSHAQFFYIFNSYHRCPKISSPEKALTINIPVMYVEDFATAFKCSSNLPMTTAHRCQL
ncbi:hypothetical protein HPB49_009181 [Dermacentor silvarum]|uniref:Uncharacterized protein n=1 Tax=Dermacentor silvarum TaxID=543639 RepID=A0ACB8CE45_DERSI|nr:hypothetical protein HPB49_009181 [Dermacentor silvarum]